MYSVDPNYFKGTLHARFKGKKKTPPDGDLLAIVDSGCIIVNLILSVILVISFGENRLIALSLDC